MKVEESTITYNRIPSKITPSEVMAILIGGSVTSRYFSLIKMFSDLSDELISWSLNLNVKTFRTYKKIDQPLRIDLQEHAVLLLSLFKHGNEVFGTKENFTKWLDTENFHYGKRKPIDYLTTSTGIKIIDDSISAMEYGDNV